MNLDKGKNDAVTGMACVRQQSIVPRRSSSRNDIQSNPSSSHPHQLAENLGQVAWVWKLQQSAEERGHFLIVFGANLLIAQLNHFGAVRPLRRLLAQAQGHCAEF